MIRYTGRRLGVQQILDDWVKEQEAAGIQAEYSGEVSDTPSGEVFVSVTRGLRGAGSYSITSIGRELAEWLRSKGVAARP